MAGRPLVLHQIDDVPQRRLDLISRQQPAQQHLRRADWDSSLVYYQRAIELDSTFALALSRASTALGWSRSGFDSLSNAYALRAGAFTRGLPPRDSLLVTADSLFPRVLSRLQISSSFTR